MKGLKKLFVMLLCMAMIIGSLSACKKSDDTKDNNSDSTSTTVTPAATPTEAAKELKVIDYTEPAEFTWWLYSTPNDYYSDYGQNPVVQYLNKKFNMTLTTQQPASGTEQDALNLMFGTGEYTDMIDLTQYTGSITQLYEDGVIINIADYLDYMPNFSKLLQDDNIRKNVYTDNGEILSLPILSTEDSLMWGGLVYRRDILETITGGNVQFPSGNAEPTTIADLDYMLPLMKQYFEAAKMTDYAPLILPATGYLSSNELISSFGTSYTYYLDNNTVKYGPMEDGFYNYLKKMNEWYEAGYIYKDFASRTSDLFYLPNTSLTYGGAAGVWFGLAGQLGTALSMPDYGLTVEVRAMKNPLDAANGITSAPNQLLPPRYESNTRTVISASCKDVERLLSALDFMYSEEGAMLFGNGLDAAHGSADNEIYAKNGLADGFYTLAADGTFTFNKNLAKAGQGGPITLDSAFTGNHLPGLSNNHYENEYSSDDNKAASEAWLAYQSSLNRVPRTIIRTKEEDDTYTSSETNIENYVNEMVLKFIIGNEKLDETSWASYKEQLASYGINDTIAIQQAAYDRYLAR